MEVQRYTLESFQDFMFGGIENVLPEKVLQIITDLTSKVSNNAGAVTYVKPAGKASSSSSSHHHSAGGGGSGGQHHPGYRAPVTSVSKRNHLSAAKPGGKASGSIRSTHADGCDWDNIRSGKLKDEGLKPLKQSTQVEEVRVLLNKLTDKNVADTVTKLEQVLVDAQKKDSDTGDEDNMVGQVARLIFEVASNNRFFSKLYAQVYAELSGKCNVLLNNVQEQWAKFMDLFLQIEYADANEDYDKFCEVNKKNERRKSLAAFYVNLVKCSLVTRSQMYALMCELLSLMYAYVQEPDRKNEVDELTETIAVLYDKEIFGNVTEDVEEMKIHGMTIEELIDRMAHSKTKDFKSLTNKSLFKFMDLMEM